MSKCNLLIKANFILRGLSSQVFGILSLVCSLNSACAVELGWDSGNSVHENAKSACPQFFVQGSEPRILNPKLALNTRQLCFSNFAVGYSPISRTPLWSAEHLSRESLARAKGLKRVNAFHEETRLPSAERAFLSDYAKSGFDRGHMSPSADQPNEQAQQDSFSLANMVPQNPNNNRHLWEGIESATRTWAKSVGELYVITGPLFIGSSVEQLHGRVMVPTHLFKIIYDPTRGAASAYLVLNKDTDEYSVITLEELSKIAGIDFLPMLDSNVQRVRIELPAPTPHHQRSDAPVEQQKEGRNRKSFEPKAQAQAPTGAEFRQVEHLLKEIARHLN